MRTIFLLLLFANLTFFAYGWSVLERPIGAGRIAALQVSPEKIRLVEPGSGAPAATSAPASASPAPASTPAAAACIEWGIVAGSDAARADAAIAALGVSQASVQRTAVNAGGYWVYLPPAANKAELDRSIAQLAASGISDFYVVQDATPWRNAISLGVFKSDDAANGFLANVHARGLATALAGHRDDLLKQFAYFVREPDQATVARLATLQGDFPGTRMKAVACPG